MDRLRRCSRQALARRFLVLIGPLVGLAVGGFPASRLMAGCHHRWTDLGSRGHCAACEATCPSCDEPAACHRCGRHHHGHCWSLPFLRALVRCVDSAECGCGEVYWGPWHNDPPDRCEPCDHCGNWVGRAEPYGTRYTAAPETASYDLPAGESYDGSAEPSEAAPALPDITPESPTAPPMRSTRRPRRRPARRW